MDKHIDIGAILENAPKGLNLYSPAYGDIKLVSVDPIDRNRKATPMICCKSRSGNEKKFFRDGTISTHGECMLFPSKESLSWEMWQRKLFKPGDIIVKDNDDKHGPAQTLLFYRLTPLVYLASAYDEKGKLDNEVYVDYYRYATEEEKNDFNRQLLFNGYEYDKNTKSMVLADKSKIEQAKKTEEELNNLFQEYKLFNVEVLKPFNVEVLKPFDKVLYLPWDSSYDCWQPGIVSMVVKDTVHLIGVDRGIRKCIPFEGNEHLIGEMVKAKDFFIRN